jgi:hypothetical protein
MKCSAFTRKREPCPRPVSRLHWPLPNKAAAQLIWLPSPSLGTAANEASQSGRCEGFGLEQHYLKNTVRDSRIANISISLP